jgi:sirohydrochlorin ferrochelatase
LDHPYDGKIYLEKTIKLISDAIRYSLYSNSDIGTIPFNMNALLIVAHGSRKLDSNQEVKDLTGKLASQVKGFDLVECAFLELAEPNILQGGIKLVEAGASSLTILPYFLVAGRHVVTDVPEEANKIREIYPDLVVTLLPYFGASENIVSEMLDRIPS